MSLTNYALSEMVEKEMTLLSLLILQFLKNEPDNENHLQEFVNKHDTLCKKLEEKLNQVKDPLNIDDIKIELNNLNKVKENIGLIKKVISKTPEMLDENVVNKINKLPENKMTFCSLCKWYCHKMECVSWSLIHTEKLDKNSNELMKLIKSIQDKVSLPGLDDDKKEDLLIMWNNAKLLLSFLITFNFVINKSYGNKQRRSRTYRKR